MGGGGDAKIKTGNSNQRLQHFHQAPVSSNRTPIAKV